MTTRHFDCVATGRPDYGRSRLSWIKRRARRLMRLNQTPRRLAIWDAWVDYVLFTGDRSVTPLRVIQGGRA